MRLEIRVESRRYQLEPETKLVNEYPFVHFSKFDGLVKINVF